jgi:hypothetical protein
MAELFQQRFHFLLVVETGVIRPERDFHLARF